MQEESLFRLTFYYKDITDRIIAMPIPCEQKITSILKNNIADVIKFLDHLHANHYRLYNLCLEGKYSYEKFQGRVSEYQFPDDGAPSLSLVVNFVNDAADWLDHHPRNVCVVHCSNGKGRTGTLVASLLLRMGACSSPSEALQVFANRRTIDGKAVVKNPSQLRYVGFYDQFRKGLLQFEVPDSIEEVDVLKIDGRGIGDASIERNIPRIITGIRLSSAPQFRRRGGCVPWFSIEQKGKRIFYSPPMKGVKNTESVYFSLLRIIVAGDIRLDFYHKNFKTKMFSCSLHTAAFKVSVISLPKRELDLAYKDKNNKHFPPNFKLEVFLAAAPDLDDPSERTSVSLQDSAQQAHSDSNDKKDEHTEEREKSGKTQATNNTSSTSSASSSTIYSASSAHSSVASISSTLSRMRASSQLASVSVIGTRCARCREVLGEDDFYLEVSGVSIHWDCLQCNECGRVFGETGRDSVVLIREAGGVGCVHCGDFRSFFPSCARCGDPVTSETDCCVSVPAATTYWHTACFACARCAAPLLFSDEDALWRIDPTNGMPICFFHPNDQPSSASSSSFFSTSVDTQIHPSPPPSSPMSGFLHSPSLYRNSSNFSMTENNDSHETIKVPVQPQSDHLSSQQPPRHVVSHQNTTTDTQSNHVRDQQQQQQSIQHRQRIASLEPYQEPRDYSLHKSASQPIQKYNSSPRPHSQPSVQLASPPNNNIPPLQTSAQRSSVSQLRHCSGCSVTVNEGEEVLVVADTVWHPACLQCAHCHVVLLPSHRVTSVNGKLFCRDDFEKLFGVSCARCHSLIEPGSSYFNTGSIQFHTECFSCVVCGKRLSDGLFFMRGEAALCEADKNHVPSSLARTSLVVPSTRDSEEALCHSVAALIKSAKDTLVALGEFDKKTFVALAKKLAAISRECTSAGDEAVWGQASKAHQDLILFCSKELSCSPPTSIQFTCNSLNASLVFLQGRMQLLGNNKQDF